MLSNTHTHAFKHIHTLFKSSKSYKIFTNNAVSTAKYAKSFANLRTQVSVLYINPSSQNWKSGRTSLVVQWLECHVSTTGSTSSIPGLGTKILHAARYSQKKKGKENEDQEKIKCKNLDSWKTNRWVPILSLLPTRRLGSNDSSQTRLSPHLSPEDSPLSLAGRQWGLESNQRGSCSWRPWVNTPAVNVIFLRMPLGARPTFLPSLAAHRTTWQPLPDRQAESQSPNWNLACQSSTGNLNTVKAETKNAATPPISLFHPGCCKHRLKL